MNKKIAVRLLAALGGKNNIRALEHCATRLRVVVKDDALIDVDQIKSTDNVAGYFFQSGQHQIILGTGLVNKVFALIQQELDGELESAKGAAYENMSPFQKALRSLADVFIPLIPVLVATGLFMGLRGFAQQLGFEFSPELLTMTQVVTDTVFIFLPALVVWSAFKRFGGTPVIGMVLGLMLIAPMLPNAWDVASGNAEMLSIGMFKIQGFQGTIIPALIVGILGANLERWINSWMPSVVSLIFTPFLTITIGMLAGLFIIGPVFNIVEHGVMVSTESIINLPMGIGGAIFGGLQQVLTVTGLHHSLMVVELNFLSTIKINPLNALITASMAGQAGAAIAYTMSIKDKKQKALNYSSIVPCFFGITEPLLFGVTLTNSRVFVSGIIGGAIAGAFATIMHIAPSVMGVTFIPAIPAYLGNGLGMYLVMIVIGMGSAAMLTKLLVKPTSNEATMTVALDK
ncbi:MULTISPECIES: PTS transporter subunit EIIC [Vibrio]|uniref:PTS transporter subunit EIIC n=1 Tax=Vibrio TaxID=662 RepID=UPI00178F83C4|nr:MULTISPECIES: PTS transporter subunit EIIC [Vibrio]MCF4172571.1 PTS transporter subunit EIIC [Vibrio sp. McD22-P3]NUW72955.1 PTS transporter subunit EIIC [Vibrio mediterranei]